VVPVSSTDDGLPLGAVVSFLPDANHGRDTTRIAHSEGIIQRDAQPTLGVAESR